MRRRYTQEEIKTVIEEHQKWLEYGGEGGSRADLRGAVLRGADLRGADLRGAVLSDAVRVHTLAVFTGLYEYQCWAFVTDSGVPWVRMGCLCKSLSDWDASGGIRLSNLREYPDDGSEKSERRVRAFEFTRAETERMAAKWSAEDSTQPD